MQIAKQMIKIIIKNCMCGGVVVDYRTRNWEVAGSTHTRSSASNLEQVANRLRAHANSASYNPTGREMSSSYGYRVKD